MRRYGSRRTAVLYTAENGRLKHETGDSHAETIEAEAGVLPSTDRCGLAGLDRAAPERVYGHNQVTDAYLLSLAVQEGLVLTSFDKALLHLAGEHEKHVLVLAAN